MPSKTVQADQPEPSSSNVPPSTACSEQLLLAAGYIPFAFGDGENVSKESLLGQPLVAAEYKYGQSPSNDAGDDDGTSKDSETAGSSTHPEGSFGQQLQESQYADSSLSLASGEYFYQLPHLELLGHSIMPPFHGMYQPRMALPPEMAPGPVLMLISNTMEL